MFIRDLFNMIMEANMDSNGYVALKVEPESESAIREAVAQLGVEPSRIINNLHLTMMFDENEPKIPLPNNSSVYAAKISDVSTLGQPDSKWFAVVLKLESPELVARFEELQELGYEHSHDSFIPHVSLIYSPTEEEVDLILSKKKELIGMLGTIYLGREYSEAINKPDPKTA